MGNKIALILVSVLWFAAGCLCESEIFVATGAIIGSMSLLPNEK